MDTPKHTPGPWVTDSDTGREYVLAPPLDENEGGATIICSMGLESEANTRLIAAAPDLLEACRQIVWKLSHDTSPSGKGDDCRPGTVDRTDATVRMAEAAIDKATI